MTQFRLSIDQARCLAIQSQRLATSSSTRGKAGISDAIDHLGYVQIDTISVIARAHHHTLWNRNRGYTPQHLHELVAIDRQVFEYWAHAVAFLPMADYRYYVPRMHRQRTSPRDGLKQWMDEHSDVLDQVLERIRREGGLSSKDFDPPPGTQRGTWWDWKPAKRALEILFWQGYLMISERKGFQKVYDLTERVLPPSIETAVPSDEELGEFHIVRALGGLGVAREKEIADAFHIANRQLLAQSLRRLSESGTVVPVLIEDDPVVNYALPSSLDRGTVPIPDQAWILSPFDNLTIQRDRMRRLFDFDYTIECYVPAAKRRYGYFVLPILWKDRMIGRLDAKADRKSKALQARSLWFEPGFSDINESLSALGRAIAEFASFNGCQTVEFDRIVPAGHKRRLKSLARSELKSLEQSAKGES